MDLSCLDLPFNLSWHYFQLIKIKDVFKLVLTFSCKVTCKSFIQFWYSECICTSLPGASCICVTIALFRNDNSSVSLWISFCVFVTFYKNLCMYKMYSGFLHILFKDRNFGNHSPSNYKILDIFSMINEGLTKQPEIKVIYIHILNIYIYIYIYIYIKNRFSVPYKT